MGQKAGLMEKLPPTLLCRRLFVGPNGQRAYGWACPGSKGLLGGIGGSEGPSTWLLLIVTFLSLKHVSVSPNTSWIIC